MKLGVIGAGAWGTALAQVAASGGDEVILWALEDEVVASVNERHENSLFLPGLELLRNIVATSDLQAVEECEAFLLVTPAQHMRSVLAALPVHDRPLILCSKGIEEASGLMMHDVAQQVRPDAPIAVLSGLTD